MFTGMSGPKQSNCFCRGGWGQRSRVKTPALQTLQLCTSGAAEKICFETKRLFMSRREENAATLSVTSADV